MNWMKRAHRAAPVFAMAFAVALVSAASAAGSLALARRAEFNLLDDQPVA